MRRAVYFVALAFALSAAACSDDDTPAKDMGVDKGTTPTPDKGTTPTPDKGTTPTPDKGTTGEAGTDATAPAGACTNADDAAKLDTKEERDAVSAKAKTCGLGCLAKPTDAEKAQCSTDCVVKETSLSAECSACYVGIILCTMKNCLVQCAADPSSQGCVDCQTTNKCYETFYTCSGMSSGPAPDGGA